MVYDKVVEKGEKIIKKLKQPPFHERK